MFLFLFFNKVVNSRAKWEVASGDFNPSNASMFHWRECVVVGGSRCSDHSRIMGVTFDLLRFEWFVVWSNDYIIVEWNLVIRVEPMVEWVAP